MWCCAMVEKRFFVSVGRILFLIGVVALSLGLFISLYEEDFIYFYYSWNDLQMYGFSVWWDLTGEFFVFLIIALPIFFFFLWWSLWVAWRIIQLSGCVVRLKGGKLYYTIHNDYVVISKIDRIYIVGESKRSLWLEIETRDKRYRRFSIKKVYLARPLKALLWIKRNTMAGFQISLADISCDLNEKAVTEINELNRSYPHESLGSLTNMLSS